MSCVCRKAKVRGRKLSRRRSSRWRLKWLSRWKDEGERCRPLQLSFPSCNLPNDWEQVMNPVMVSRATTCQDGVGGGAARPPFPPRLLREWIRRTRAINEQRKTESRIPGFMSLLIGKGHLHPGLPTRRERQEHRL